MDGHDIELRAGLWFCTTEMVDADECTDYNRCDYDCVCNQKDS